MNAKDCGATGNGITDDTSAIQDALNGNEELEEWEEQERGLIQESRKLEEKRIEKATEEINKILEKYGVQLEGIAIIKATEIRIVPKRG